MNNDQGVPSNLTITNQKLIVNNKLCCNELTFFNEANNELDISHNVVNIFHTLKTDEITSLRDPDDLVDATELKIKHEIVTIPERLKVDRLRSLVDPVLGQTIPSELNINHDLVRIEEILLVNKIETSSTTEQLEANPAMKTKLEITHEEIKIPSHTFLTTLKTDTINPFSDAVTVPPTERILTIGHDTVLIPHQLKTDKISSILQSQPNAQRTLQISHDFVNIPTTLKTDRISSVTPITNPPTETSLTLSHNNIIVSNKLNVDAINPIRNVATNPPTESVLTLAHNNIYIPSKIKTNSINSILNSDTMNINGKKVIITASNPTPTNEDTSHVTLIGNTVSVSANSSAYVSGKQITIGNLDGTSDVIIYGNVHFVDRQNTQSFF